MASSVDLQYKRSTNVKIKNCIERLARTIIRIIVPSLTIKRDFLVRKEIKDIVEKFALLQVFGVDVPQGIHDVGARAVRMDTECLVRGAFMVGSSPGASDSAVSAAGYSVEKKNRTS